MNVPCDINSFIRIVAGTATASITNGIGRVTATSDTTATGKYEHSILAGPGCTVEMKVFCRATRGYGSVAIDWLPIDRGGDWIDVISPEWQEYTVSFTTPMNCPDSQRATFVIGSFTSGDGDIEFHSPRISMTNTDLGAPRVLGRGLILISSGVPSLNSNYVTQGILGLSYTPDNASLAITLRKNYGAGVHLHPLLWAQITMDATSVAARKLSPKPGKYDRDTGVANVQFVDSTLGASQDITSYGDIYLFFEAEI